MAGKTGGTEKDKGSDNNFSTTLLVDRPPKTVFDAINNVRGWWSQEIDGKTDELGAEFKYHYRDVHRSKFRITEFVPGKKVVWHVLDNYFNFVKDKTEWINTDIVFDIAKKGDKTEIRFTHKGLVPAYECYGVCSEAWGSYVTGSLRDLITTGRGKPNPLEDVVSKAREMSGRNYTASFTVDQTPEEVFAAVNNVRGWWSEEIVGSTDKVGADFKFHYKDVHHSTQKITELVPGRKIVWHVSDSRLNFVKDKTEWNGTDIVFGISKKNGRTELRFEHVGLVPALECYEGCSEGWGFYINDSLRSLIATGKGQPNKKEKGKRNKAA
jgi:uncharacterized protein YndB with AHSA1/START domain